MYTFVSLSHAAFLRQRLLLGQAFFRQGKGEEKSKEICVWTEPGQQHKDHEGVRPCLSVRDRTRSAGPPTCTQPPSCTQTDHLPAFASPYTSIPYPYYILRVSSLLLIPILCRISLSSPSVPLSSLRRERRQLFNMSSVCAIRPPYPITTTIHLAKHTHARQKH